MKQDFKHRLVVALLLLLSSVTMDAVQAIDVSAVNIHKECSSPQACFFSQAHTTPSFDRFQIYHLNMPCEQGHSKASHIPADKCMLRLFSRFREYKTVNQFYPYDALHLSIHGLSNPVAYYVYGLRKIIV